ncbi:MAG TPA: membrane protein insertase YidC [Sulfurospirillum sp. UBA11407]|nr:MAG TPA: membrane protein insertase YidC [Sulfurospirillum sp. UBA11407]
MIDKLSNQSRIIIATVLSFLFFASYDYFFIPKPEKQTTNIEQTQKEVSKTAPTTPTANTNVPTPTTTQSDEPIVKVVADKYELHIDKLGRINKFFLKEDKFILENGERMQLIDSSFSPYPLEVRFSDTNLNNEAFKTPYEADNTSVNVTKDGVKVVLTQKLSSLNVTKTLTFFPSGNYSLDLTLDKPQTYFITPGLRPNQLADGYTFHGALVKEADDTHTPIEDGDAKGTERFLNAKIAAGADRYYTTALYNFDKGFDIIVQAVNDGMPLLFIKGTEDLKIDGYIGPKEYKTLFQIDHRLTDIIEYGFFTFISKPLFLLLSYLHTVLGNWGWAIVALTIIIRLVLFPLTYKGMVSMNKLKELAPKIKELQAKYKGDNQKLNAHMMELYKKHGANPMGGCLPILLQIPVFFAIYRVLQNAIELKAAPWIFWIKDLAVMDPYFILPVAMGVTMFLHQRITPTNFTDPMQEKIMKYLPLIFTFFFVTFPAGLTLYWFVNNLFSIVQQYYVNSLFAKKKEEKVEK